MGTFNADGTYVPRVITEDNLVGTDLAELVGNSVLEFEDGDLVVGTVVKIDHDEVVVEAPEIEKQQVEAIVLDCLMNAAKLTVPLEVSLHWGDNWAAAKG